MKNTKYIDITNKRFGRLVAIKPCEKTKHGWKWLCKCDCGNSSIVLKHLLTSGHTTSCGCYHKERTRQAHYKNGESHTRLYKVWLGMKGRCENPKDKSYIDYGNRGISVCEEWQDYMVFKSWAYANGYDENAKPGDCTIDRIDNNGNYEPDNCKFSNVKEQANNRRSSRMITFRGETLSIAGWAEKTGLRHGLILNRINNGWSVEKALTTPSSKANRWLEGRFEG